MSSDQSNSNIIPTGVRLVNACMYAISKRDLDIIDKLKNIPEASSVLEKIQNLKNTDNPEYGRAQHEILIKSLFNNLSKLQDILAEDAEKLNRYELAHRSTHMPVINQMLASQNSEDAGAPSLVNMASNFTKAVIDFTKSGFAVASDEKYAERLDICNACPKLDQAAFGGTGRCLACGCSIKAKLKILSSTCPLEKW